MTDYRQALPQEEDDILDLANLAFSLVRQPCDFKALVPKVYCRPGFYRHHVVAVRDGRLKALVGLLPFRLRLSSLSALQLGFVGTVSVHPYARGEGHMKALMQLILDSAKAQGMDMMVLGGQRQRYNYFGFENAGSVITYTVSATNLRHALKDQDVNAYRFLPFSELAQEKLSALWQMQSVRTLSGERSMEDFSLFMQTWQGKSFAVMQSNALLGYIYANRDSLFEWELQPGESLLPVLKAFIAQEHLSEIRIRLPLHRKEDMCALSQVAAGYEISDSCMLRVLDWQSTLQKLLAFKAGLLPLEDGEVVLEVLDKGRWLIKVLEGRPQVTLTQREPSLRLAENAAVLMLFSMQSRLLDDSRLWRNWLPLYFSVPEADAF
jgi:predicted acetyltransferase